MKKLFEEFGSREEKVGCWFLGGKERQVMSAVQQAHWEAAACRSVSFHEPWWKCRTAESCWCNFCNFQEEISKKESMPPSQMVQMKTSQARFPAPPLQHLSQITISVLPSSLPTVCPSDASDVLSSIPPEGSSFLFYFELYFSMCLLLPSIPLGQHPWTCPNAGWHARAPA